MGLLSVTLLASCLALQDDDAEMKWTFGEGDLFDLKYSYAEARRGESGAGEARTLSETNDKRDVDAELVFKEPGVLSVRLKKVAWTYGTQEYDITLSFVAGKDPQVGLRLKLNPKDPTFPTAKAQAEALTEQFKHLAEGEYSVETSNQETVFRRSSGGSFGRLALFDRIFTHPPLPRGSVKKGQAWKEPLEQNILPAGTLEDKPVLEHKVTAVTGKDLTVKAGVQVPIVKPPAPGSTLTHTGNFTYSREWSFAREGHLSASKEEIQYTRKVDAKGKDADFYKSSSSHKVTQQLKITRKAAK